MQDRDALLVQIRDLQQELLEVQREAATVQIRKLLLLMMLVVPVALMSALQLVVLLAQSAQVHGAG